MGNRTAKFVSALVGSIIAGAPLAAVSQNAPGASTASGAGDCLASPKGAAPQGQHWRYHVERGTKRQCWYLRATGDKDSAKAAQTAQVPANTSDSPPPPQQTVQDARAEYVAPRSGAAQRTPNAITPMAPANPTPAQQPPSQTAESSAQQATVASPWPDVPAASTDSEPQPATTTVAAAAQPKAKQSKSPASLPPAATDGTTERPGGSVQMLMLVIGGALALAGIIASVITRCAGGRVRTRAADHRGHWEDWTPQDHDGSRAPWQDPAQGLTPHAQPRPVDFDEARPPQAAQLAAFPKKISTIAVESTSIRTEAAELDKADIFNGTFEIEASPPRLTANKSDDEKPISRDEDLQEEDVQTDDAVDVDVITAMLERLAKQGPRLPRLSPEVDLASLARNQRGQSAARA